MYIIATTECSTGGRTMPTVLTSLIGCVPPQPPRLLDQLRQSALSHYGRPEPADRHVEWVRRFILFHGKRHPRDLKLEAAVVWKVTPCNRQELKQPTGESPAFCSAPPVAALLPPIFSHRA